MTYPTNIRTFRVEPPAPADPSHLRREPGATHLRVALNTCETCRASNPTRPGEPFPARCAICGAAMRKPESWDGRGDAGAFYRRSRVRT